MPPFPASSHGLRTTFNRITAARLRSLSASRRFPWVESCPPGSSPNPRGSTRRPLSTWPSHLASLLRPLVSLSTSAPAMRKSASRWRIIYGPMGRALDEGNGTRLRSGSGSETVIHDSNLHCDYHTRRSLCHWLLPSCCTSICRLPLRFLYTVDLLIRYCGLLRCTSACTNIIHDVLEHSIPNEMFSGLLTWT